MLMTLVAEHGPVLAQYADAHTSHAVLADATQHAEAANFLQKVGKAIFGVLAGIFVVGALVGLLIGFLVGRAVGRRTPDNVGA
ncbi:hypothetical protein EV383_1295 [Pseudonocardia sediminis]|uniref:Uncharacterized protein n=1 Tax=Pseudonocardia sediminis TaxID=1397368 RepID=A0A4Q7UTV9_PSEST|nr:hypothetical protein [Pseudonocardia sediminis]RZT84454.1 hypothetical protein EV383_1295 [Pseudonocardia sediminis]